jgi:hypothetical protein
VVLFNYNFILKKRDKLMLTKLIQKQNNTMFMSMRSFSAANAKYDMVVIGGGPGGKKKQF